jgi:hypothetical protein
MAMKSRNYLVFEDRMNKSPRARWMREVFTSRQRGYTSDRLRGGCHARRWSDGPVTSQRTACHFQCAGGIGPLMVRSHDDEVATASSTIRRGIW